MLFPCSRLSHRREREPPPPVFTRPRLPPPKLLRLKELRLNELRLNELRSDDERFSIERVRSTLLFRRVLLGRV